jgi:parvulin-like peptidyl-prolyl isomerase
VASVNGKSLSEAEFAQLCESASQVQAGRGTVGQQVLLQWVQNAMFAVEAKKHGVYPSEAELTTRVNAFKKQAAANGMNYQEQLMRQGLTEKSFRRDLLIGLIRENVLLRGITVTDDEVRKEFDLNKKNFTAPAQVQISQITLDTEDKLKKAKDDLAANTQFSLVASTHSKDEFAQGGGKVPVPLPKVIPPGAGVPIAQAVVDAAFKLQPGQVSEPVKVGANWVIVKLDEMIAEKVPDFENYREPIKAELRSRKVQQNPAKQQEIQRELQQMQAGAQVTINRPEYRHLLDSVRAGAAGSGPGATGPVGSTPGPPPDAPQPQQAAPPPGK